ncbi:MAG: TVP38/TMEM64 family protein [Fusobacteriaceae bacterium]
MNKIKKKIFILAILILVFVFLKIKIFPGKLDVDTVRVFLLTLKNNEYSQLIFIALYILFSIFFLPATPLTLSSGIIFGPIKGSLLTLIGASLGLGSSFLLGRYFFKDSMKKYESLPIFKMINEGIKKNDSLILLTTRLVPIFPFTLQNYVYGLTNISFFKYWFLSTIFIIPGVISYVLIGSSLLASSSKEFFFIIGISATLLLFVALLIKKFNLKK